MKRIALITPMLQPYRITFYEKLSKIDPNLQWIFFYGKKKQDDGKPGFLGPTTFNAQGYVLLKQRIGPYTLRYNKGLFRAIRQYMPDLVILQSISGNYSNRAIVNWAKRKGVKIIYWTCGYEPGLAKGFLLKLKYFFATPFFRKANFHLTYSTTASKYTEQMGIDASIIKTCYNGIELDPLQENESQIMKNGLEIRSKYNLDNYTTFLYVGALTEPKRPGLLVDAFVTLFERYKNIKLLIIGEGPEKEKILTKLKAIDNENICYLGRIVDSVDDYFAACDCFVLPGIGGLALNQGMFWRKVCIVSTADGTEDDLIIDGKTGFRFITDDKLSLAKAMEKRIMMSAEDALKMGNTARELIINRSNVNQMVNTFHNTIIDIL
jgi:glycosyltransferase involved in cell wall biosynthesis